MTIIEKNLKKIAEQLEIANKLKVIELKFKNPENLNLHNNLDTVLNQKGNM